jgi:hypothetical protein
MKARAFSKVLRPGSLPVQARPTWAQVRDSAGAPQADACYVIVILRIGLHQRLPFG